MSAAQSSTLPGLAVSVAAFRGRELLLVRRGKAPYAGFWSLPGGAVEPGERLREAARREVFEETGLDVEIGPLVDLHEIIRRNEAGRVQVHVVIAVFRAKASGLPVAADDAAEARFVDPAELDHLDTTPGLAAIVARAAAAQD